MKVLSVINNDKDAVTKEYVDSKAGVTAVDPTSGPVETDFFIPTKTSELTNDSGFITEAALTTKQDTLVSGTNIKTINNQSLLGSGNISLATVETDPIFNASAAKNITSTDITNWNNKSDFSGSYNDLTDLPVPTDIRINNSSIISGGVANLGVLPDYNSSTNPLATMGAVSQGMNAIMDEVDKKQDTLVSGTNIKTINNESILGSGNINISGGGNVQELSSDFNAWDLEEGFYRTSSSVVISYHDDGMVNQDTLPAWTRLNVFRAIEPGDNEQYSAIWHLYIEVYAPTSESIRKNIYYECSYRDITSGEHYLGYGTKYSIIPTTNVKINGTSITSTGTANIITEGTYNASTNKIVTKSYVDDIVGDIESLLGGI